MRTYTPLNTCGVNRAKDLYQKSPGEPPGHFFIASKDRLGLVDDFLVLIKCITNFLFINGLNGLISVSRLGEEIFQIILVTRL